MTPRVREILSWYGAASAGTLTNLARLLNHAETANCVKAKAAARVTGSTSTATGTKTSPAPIAAAVAKITPIALRSQPMRTFRTPKTVRRLSRHGGISKHLLFELCFFHAPEHGLQESCRLFG
jgi:hypothetical protein